jgi:plasmid stability protein
MAEVKIRQLPDWVVEAHKQQAQRTGTSLEQHLRTLITESAHAQKGSFLQIARACRENLQQELGGKLPDRTADIVREMRDERG